EDIRNTKAYKEYYACATGEAVPKPKASARRKREEQISWNSSDDEDVDGQTKGRDDNEGLMISEEERMQEEEESDELYCDIDINQGRRLQVSQDIDDSHVTLTP
nr:hypothetical protein [Tanacetum cinerariifolium]